MPLSDIVNINTYDPKLVIVTIGGVPISGFADGPLTGADYQSGTAIMTENITIP
jgi:hypothetical protein